MKDEQLKYSLETGQLRLGFIDKFNHYAIVVFLSVVPVMLVFIFLKGHFDGTPTKIDISYALSFSIPLILCLLLYKQQKDRLKFKTIQTKLNRQEIDLHIEKVAKKLEWTTHKIGKNYIVMKTNPSFLTGSWGEKITILFDNHKVMVNSICDPDKPSSIASFGRNKKNEISLLNELQKNASPQQTA